MRIAVVRKVLVVALVAVAAASMAVLMAQAPSGAKPLAQELTNTDAAIKAAAELAKREAATKDYAVPRTPWGDPDLRGV